MKPNILSFLGIVLFLIIGVSLVSANCIHDEMMKKYPPITVGSKKAVRTAPAGYSAFKVYFDTSFLDNGADAAACYTENAVVVVSGSAHTCTSADLLTTAKKNFIIKTLLPWVELWANSTLSVDNATAPTLSGSGCGTFSTGGLTMPTGYHLYVFVTSRPTSNKVQAYAGYCQIDGSTNRPIMGYMNFNPALTDPSNKVSLQQGVARHEFTHILGFSSSNTDLWSQTKNVTKSFGMIPRAATLLISPNVVAAARLQFGCENMEGMELEDGGGDGTALSHWEARLAQGEMMAGNAQLYPRASNLTLALLDDTGYYKVDYSQAEFLPWGKGVGCDFVNTSCATWSRENGACTSEDDGCTWDYTAKGVCGLQTGGDALPLYYQYYSGAPTKGGRDELADYCPFSIAYTTGACNAEGNTPTALSGEKYCPECKCFKTNVEKRTVLRLLTPITTGKTDSWVNSCYETACATNSLLKVKVDSYWYDCNTEGDTVEIYGAYGGVVVCPKIARLCGGSSSSNSWPVITGISPEIGRAGESVIVTGTGFGSLATSVSFQIGGIEAKIMNATDTQLSVVLGDYDSVQADLGDGKTFAYVTVGSKGTFVQTAFQVIPAKNDMYREYGYWVQSNPTLGGSVTGVVSVLIVLALTIAIVKTNRVANAKVHPKNEQPGKL